MKENQMTITVVSGGLIRVETSDGKKSYETIADVADNVYGWIEDVMCDQD